MRGGTPVAGFILLHPGVQFKAVERDALSTNRDFGDVRPDFDIESIAVHAEVARRIAEPEQPRGEGHLLFLRSVHFRKPISDPDTPRSLAHARDRARYLS